jgi:uncharacterized protein
MSASLVTVTRGPPSTTGLLYTPDALQNISPVIIVIHPGGDGAHERTASLYASKLAREGFATICFDLFLTRSEGQGNTFDDPASCVSDVWATIDHLRNEQAHVVDPNRIGILGICVGGGYAVAAAIADPRLRAVATVSMVNIGDVIRHGWYGEEDAVVEDNPMPPPAYTQEISSDASSEEPENESSTPEVAISIHENLPASLRQANDCYLRSRRQRNQPDDEELMSGIRHVLTFDAFAFAELHLKQPLFLLAGSEAESLWHSERLAQLVGAKVHVVKGATHTDFYAQDLFVDHAVRVMAGFMRQALG